MTDAQKIEALTELLDTVISALGMTHLVIDDESEASYVSRAADKYFLQMLDILNSEDTLTTGTGALTEQSRPLIIDSVERHTTMTDTEQLHQDFLRDFSELLQRYNADFGVYEDVPEINFNGIYQDGETIRPFSEITLPRYINPN